MRTKHAVLLPSMLFLWIRALVTCITAAAGMPSGPARVGDAESQGGGRLTAENVVGACQHRVPSCAHKRPGEQSGVDALRLPHVNPVRNSQPENAVPTPPSEDQ